MSVLADRLVRTGSYEAGFPLLKRTMAQTLPQDDGASLVVVIRGINGLLLTLHTLLIVSVMPHTIRIGGTAMSVFLSYLTPIMDGS